MVSRWSSLSREGYTNPRRMVEPKTWQARQTSNLPAIYGRLLLERERFFGSHRNEKDLRILVGAGLDQGEEFGEVLPNSLRPIQPHM